MTQDHNLRLRPKCRFHRVQGFHGTLNLGGEVIAVSIVTSGAFNSRGVADVCMGEYCQFRRQCLLMDGGEEIRVKTEQSWIA